MRWLTAAANFVSSDLKTLWRSLPPRWTEHRKDGILRGQRHRVLLCAQPQLGLKFQGQCRRLLTRSSRQYLRRCQFCSRRRGHPSFEIR